MRPGITESKLTVGAAPRPGRLQMATGGANFNNLFHDTAAYIMPLLAQRGLSLAG